VLATQLGLEYDRWQIDVALAATYAAVGSPAANASAMRAAETAAALAARVTDTGLRARMRMGQHE
jgi:hypothetical protein